MNTSDNQRVWVAVYDTKKHIETRAFKSEEAALSWREQLARKYWHEKFVGFDMPESNVGEKYFDSMASFINNNPKLYKESFFIFHSEIEDVLPIS